MSNYNLSDVIKKTKEEQQKVASKSKHPLKEAVAPINPAGSPSEVYLSSKPIDTSEDDIDPDPHGNNTIPYLSTENLANLIERTGIPTTWERAYSCPCFNPKTEQPQSSCEFCRGTGILYKPKKVLQIIYQSNEKSPVNGYFGTNDVGTTIATPQLTENGIENGISFRDRLTIPGLSMAQSYMFNVTPDRYRNGKYIPFLVLQFTDVYTLLDGKLETLHKSESEDTFNAGEGDFWFDGKSNHMYLKEKYIGCNITMSISAMARYYVVDIAKETRVTQVKKDKDKNVALNYGDERLTNYFNQYSKFMEPGTIYVRQPKKLILRREDISFIDSEDIAVASDEATTPKQTLKDRLPNSKPNTSISDLFSGLD